MTESDRKRLPKHPDWINTAIVRSIAPTDVNGSLIKPEVAEGRTAGVVVGTTAAPVEGEGEKCDE